MFVYRKHPEERREKKSGKSIISERICPIKEIR
jgi:hypothetical protein